MYTQSSLFSGVRFHNAAKNENPQITDRPPKTMLYSFRFLFFAEAL